VQPEPEKFEFEQPEFKPKLPVPTFNTQIPVLEIEEDKPDPPELRKMSLGQNGELEI